MPEGLFAPTKGTFLPAIDGNFILTVRAALDPGARLAHLRSEAKVQLLDLTTAKGDELWALLSGAFTSPAMIQGTYTFAGGTGRFAKATGQGIFLIYAPSGVTATFKGTINY